MTSTAFPLILTTILLVFSSLGLDESLMDRIETAIIRKDYESAQLISQKALSGETLAPQIRARVQYYLGVSYLNQQKYDDAQAVFERLIDSKPEDLLRDKAYLGLFNIFYRQKEYADALGLVKRLLDISPDSQLLSLIHLKIARAHLKMAQWSDAHKHLNIIRREFPRSLEDPIARQLLEEKQYFSVQVGAFTDKDRAEQLMRDLKLNGEYAYLVETKDAQNRTFYRVRVGQTGRLEEAENLRAKLSREGYPALIYP